MRSQLTTQRNFAARPSNQQMSDLSFEQTVAASIIDKIALGSVVGIGAYVVNRWLERYKSRQAMVAEAAKVRVAKIAELWQGLHDVRSRIIDLSMQTMWIIIDERRKLTNEALGELQSEELPESAPTRIGKEMGPAHEDVGRTLASLESQLLASRFWLGKRLYDLHVEHLQALRKLLKLVWKRAESTKDATIADNLVVGRELRSSEVDVTTIIPLL